MSRSHGDARCRPCARDMRPAVLLALAVAACAPSTRNPVEDPDPRRPNDFGLHDAEQHGADGPARGDALNALTPADAAGPDQLPSDASALLPIDDGVLEPDAVPGPADASWPWGVGLDSDPNEYCANKPPSGYNAGYSNRREENQVPYYFRCQTDGIISLSDGVPEHFLTGIQDAGESTSMMFIIAPRGYEYREFVPPTAEVSLTLRLREQVFPGAPAGLQCVTLRTPNRPQMMIYDLVATFPPSPRPQGAPESWRFTGQFWLHTTMAPSTDEEARSACDFYLGSPPGQVEWPIFNLSE